MADLLRAALHAAAELVHLNRRVPDLRADHLPAQRSLARTRTVINYRGQR